MPYISAEQRLLEISENGENLIDAIKKEISFLVSGGEKRARMVRTVISGLINGAYGGAIRVVPYESVNKDTANLILYINKISNNIINMNTKHNAGKNGLLNYTITRVLNEVYFSPRYHDYNEISGLLTGLILRTCTEDDEVLGILDCCKAEYYRKYCAPYEDLKESENGLVKRDIGSTSLY